MSITSHNLTSRLIGRSLVQTRALLLASLAPLAFACAAEEPAADNVRDVRATLPPEVDGYRNIVGGEYVIQPGEDKMICFHLTWKDPTIAVSSVQQLQGKFGHHSIIVTTKEPKPDGTVEDCTEQKDMYKYGAFLIPVDELPAGHGIELPQGMKIVLQSHYVNYGDQAILTRDAVRIRTMPTADVKTWVASLATNSTDFSVPAKSVGNETFDCTLDEDVELLLFGGHMHEDGKSFEGLMGPDVKSLKSLQRVDEWKEEYRDSPPVMLALKAPVPLKKGTVLRTICEWNNKADHVLAFPEEMCASFGYIAGTKKAYDCRKDKGKVTW